MRTCDERTPAAGTAAAKATLFQARTGAGAAASGRGGIGKLQEQHRRRPGWFHQLHPSRVLFQHRLMTLTIGVGDIRVALMSDAPDLSLHVQKSTERFLVDDDRADVIVRARWGALHDSFTGNEIFDSGGL